VEGRVHGYTYLARPDGTALQWVPGGQIPSGTYCVVTWRKNPNGAITKLASECAGITAVG